MDIKWNDKAKGDFDKDFCNWVLSLFNSMFLSSIVITSNLNFGIYKVDCEAFHKSIY